MTDSEKPLSEFDKMPEQFRKTIMFASYFSGMSKDISDIEIMALFGFAKRRFGELSCLKIQDAFDMCAAKELPVNPSFHKSFSPSFLGDVLSAYKNHKPANRLSSTISASLKKENLKQLEKPKEVIKPPEQRNKEAHDFICSYIERKNTIPNGADWIRAYKHAVKIGGIDMDDDEKAIFKEMVVEQLHEELKTSKLEMNKWMESHILLTLKNPNRVKTECKVRACKYYFRKKYNLKDHESDEYQTEKDGQESNHDNGNN